MATLTEIKNLVEKVKGLLAELHDFGEVASILNMSSEELHKQLKWVNPHILYPDDTLVKMYRAFMPVHIISRKSHVPIGTIVYALKEGAGYRTFFERFGKIKHADLVAQAAFCKDRDRLIALYYKRGWTITELENEFGLSYNFLKQILQEAGFRFEVYVGLHRSPGNKTQIRNEEIYDEYRAGATTEELCEKYKLTEKSINDIIRGRLIKYFPLMGRRKRATYKTDTKIKFRKKF